MMLWTLAPSCSFKGCTILTAEMRFGFGDLVTGNTKLAISRGNPKGNKAEALGSTLSYNITVAPAGTVGTSIRI